MSKTWLSVVTALGLAATSGAIFLARRSVLGPESGSPPGWEVRLVIDGMLQAKDASVTVVRPLDFRRQHISEERSLSGTLWEPLKAKRSSQTKKTWRLQRNMGKPEPFHLEYSFLCFRQGPTPGMERRTAQKDAAPAKGAFLQATPAIQVKDRDIVAIALELAPDDMSPLEQARALLGFAFGLFKETSRPSQTALGCLQNAGGDALGKARLLTALCRSRGIQTRMITGLVLAPGSKRQPHYWAEAWLGGQWLPLDPTHGHFGPDAFPDNFLVLRMGDGSVVAGRGAKIQYGFTIEDRHAETGPEADSSPSAAKNFWRKTSLYSLHVSEQHVVEFLLLLPLAALIVSGVRTLIGIQTFGIFAPALIGLAFLDLRALPWGLPIFVLTVLVGWGIRHWLERYHLLQVPRLAAMLTLIVIFLLAMIVTASHFGVTTTRYVSLFPLIILIFLVERFWTIEAEDSTATSFKILLGTICVAIAVSIALGPIPVRTWMFRYPETLGCVLAAQFLLGRYTGYRLTELYRFEDLIKEEPAPGGKP